MNGIEGFKPQKQEKPKTPEKLSNWRENKKEAPERARVHLVEHGLLFDIVTAPYADLEKLVKEIPVLIQELSFDASKEVENENRYVVKELADYLLEAQAQLNYLNAPKSRIRV